MSLHRVCDHLFTRVPARLTAFTVVLLLLGGCGASSVQVEGSFPSPNIQPMPLTVGVYYTDELSNFEYTEYDADDNEQYIVAAGQSHMDLFNTILPAMFREVETLDERSDAAEAGVDAVFVPSIDEYQLALPQKTRLDVYEVWIRYNMRLEEPDGDQIADWVLSSYGNTPQGTFSSTESGINEATVEALRDLASSFTLGFREEPDINDWLQARAE